MTWEWWLLIYAVGLLLSISALVASELGNTTGEKITLLLFWPVNWILTLVLGISIAISIVVIWVITKVEKLREKWEARK